MQRCLTILLSSLFSSVCLEKIILVPPHSLFQMSVEGTNDDSHNQGLSAWLTHPFRCFAPKPGLSIPLYPPFRCSSWLNKGVKAYFSLMCLNHPFLQTEQISWQDKSCLGFVWKPLPNYASVADDTTQVWKLWQKTSLLTFWPWIYEVSSFHLLDTPIKMKAHKTIWPFICIIKSSHQAVAGRTGQQGSVPCAVSKNCWRFTCVYRAMAFLFLMLSNSLPLQTPGLFDLEIVNDKLEVAYQKLRAAVLPFLEKNEA